ncbi:MAG: trigger factor, partial [Rhodothermales bacterium]
EYNLLGQPVLTELEYEMDSNLRAVVRFGIRPEVELRDVSSEVLSRLKHDVSEEDVEKQLARIKSENADLVPIEDEPIDENFQAIIDLQRIDEESGSPIIGEREEGVQFFLDDERLHDELRDGLLGKKAGDVFRVDLPHGHEDHVHMHRYEVTIKETKRRELQELDDAFVEELTKNRLHSVEELRDDLRKNLVEAWKQQSQEILDGRIVDRMLDLHKIPVPQSAVEVFLDSFVEDVRRRNEGKLPAHFDEEAFRKANQGEAERQAKWMLIRDAFIEQEALKVSDEDLDTYFENAAKENEKLSKDLLRQYYQSLNMIDRVKQQILSRKVFDRLAELFTIEEKDVDDLEKEVEETDGHHETESHDTGTTIDEVR